MKALYIIRKKRLPVRGHDLIKLGRAVKAWVVLDELKILNPHYTIARYPNAANTNPSEAYSREITERCIQAASKVIDWIKNTGRLP